jgi:hypothetical protein
VPEPKPISHEDLSYALGRLDAKVDILLSGQDRRDLVLKEVSDRLSKVESDIVALTTERQTAQKHTSAVWAFIMAGASLLVTAFTAVADKIPL